MWAVAIAGCQGAVLHLDIEPQINYAIGGSGSVQPVGIHPARTVALGRWVRSC